ncbi:hypothetical protein NR798_36960 [Archangium gephyra]|uniref:hypothetical protein n=1 Tax=Archangium gephyra TaxID=48 RepID=UPI0035D3FA4C
MTMGLSLAAALLLAGVPGTEARVVDQIDLHLDLINSAGYPLPTPVYSLGLSVQVRKELPWGLYLGLREHVVTPWRTFISSDRNVRSDTQAIGGIGWPVGRSWQLSLGLQAGVRTGYSGGPVSYQEGRYAFSYDNWSARFSSQAVLGYRHDLSDSFGLSAQLAFPLTNMIGELFDGDTGLLSVGVVWRPGAGKSP